LRTVSRFKNKYGQAWYLDIFVGVLIFVIGFSVLLKVYVNTADTEKVLSTDLAVESRFLSEMLLSEGTPDNWNSTNVITIGLMEDNRLSEKKIAALKEINYNDTRSLFRLRYDYLIFLENRTGIVQMNGSYSIGKPEINRDNIIDSENPVQLAKTTRFVVYKSQIVKLVVYTWE
jgi:hypothetical protein